MKLIQIEGPNGPSINPLHVLAAYPHRALFGFGREQTLIHLAVGRHSAKFIINMSYASFQRAWQESTEPSLEPSLRSVSKNTLGS